MGNLASVCHGVSGDFGAIQNKLKIWCGITCVCKPRTSLLPDEEKIIIN